jgi:hypothetical protein
MQHKLLLFTGSIIMTLMLLLLGASSQASSTLHLTLWNQGSFTIELDRTVYPASTVFTSNNLKSGKHRIKVTQVMNGQRGIQAERVVYNGFIEIPPNTMVKATVQRDNRLEIDNVRNKIRVRPVERVQRQPQRKSDELIRCGTGMRPQQANLHLSAFEHKALIYKLDRTPLRQRKAQTAIDHIGNKHLTPQQAGEIVNKLKSKKEQKKFHHWAKERVQLRKPGAEHTSPKRKMTKG